VTEALLFEPMSSWKNNLFILILAAWNLPVAESFVAPKTTSSPFPGLADQRCSSRVGSFLESPSRLGATIEFTGESESSILVPFPPESSGSNRTLPRWVLSSDSDKFFIGTDNVRPRKDGNWDALQPSIDWFGLQLIPFFVIKLERCASRRQASAMIQEARSDIKSGAESVGGNIISKLMEKSTFRGGTTFRWKESPSSNGWILKAHLTLTLSILLPPFLPLPPGFNSIGSRIVKSTCRKRLQDNIKVLQRAYLRWAKEKESAVFSEPDRAETSRK
jgi:hypothetical protein